MIDYEGAGDLFTQRAQTLVCTTNVVGAMGKGVALRFKNTVPGLYEFYLSHFPKTNKPAPGLVNELKVYRIPGPGSMRQVLLFPTKEHWVHDSKPEWIDANLRTLAQRYKELGITSLALPPLGCGNGGLKYGRDVGPLIYRHLDPLPIPVRVLFGL